MGKIDELDPNGVTENIDSVDDGGKPFTDKVAKKAQAEIKAERQAKIDKQDSIQDTIRAEKKNEKGFLDRAGENVAIAKQAIYERTGQSADPTGSATMIADQNKKNRATIREDNKRSTMEVTAFLDDYTKDMTPEDATKARTGILRGISQNFADIKIDGAMASQVRAQKFLNVTIKGLKQHYWLSTGNLNMAEMESNAKKMVGDKPDTRRSGLDQLQADGAPEMDMPEIPDDAAAYLAETATAMLGDIIQNSIAMSQGGTSLIAKSQVEGPGQRTADKVATMMSMDVAKYREKVDKIRLMNQQLQVQHKRDVFSAMVDFDNRAAADERAYNTSLFQAKGMEVSNAYTVLGMENRAREVLNNIGTFIDAQHNAHNQNKDRQELAIKTHNSNVHNSKVNQDARFAHDEMMLQGRRDLLAQKGKLASFKRLFDNSSLMVAAGVTNASAGINFVTSMNDIIPKTQNNLNNYSAGQKKGMDIYGAINVSAFTKEEQATIANNIIFANTTGRTLNDLTEATLRKLSTEKITQSPAGNEFNTGASLLSLFDKRSFTNEANESAYLTGSAHGLLDGLSSALESQKYQYKSLKKTDSSEIGSPAITSQSND